MRNPMTVSDIYFYSDNTDSDTRFYFYDNQKEYIHGNFEDAYCGRPYFKLTDVERQTKIIAFRAVNFTGALGKAKECLVLIR